MMSPAPYPLLFEPILKEKIWGGRRLAHYGKALAPGATVGESWEITDLARTSPSGGGGGAARSIVRNGARAGATIHDLVREWGPALLGQARSTPDGGFPLLIKFLDAGENLSVQVHPSAAYAATHPEAHLKHEAWCVVDAEPDSFIYRGLKPGVTRDDLVRRIEDGSVSEALIAIPAFPGEIIHLPSGVAHALGAGVLVAEVQTPSDTTYRLDDWGRTGRELHIAEALASAFDEDGQPTIPASALPAPSRSVVETEAFRIELHALTTTDAVELRSESSLLIVMVLDGEAEVACPGDVRVELRRGGTALIPAAVSPCEASGVGTMLAITIP